MSPGEYLREIALPFRSMPVMLAGLLFVLPIGTVVLVSLVNALMAAGLGAVFALLLLPGLARYLIQITEWRAEGRQAEPPTAEMLAPAGGMWQLSALLIPAGCLAAWYGPGRGSGIAIPLACLFVLSAVYPAVTGVLAVTHSAVQAFSPRAIVGVISRIGTAYWYASVTAVAAAGIPAVLARYSTAAAIVALIYCLFSFFAVSGAVLRRPKLAVEPALPEPVEADPGQQRAALQQRRASVLTHAYGFASRGNREGASRHVEQWMLRDPDPDDARRWFLERMLLWEHPEHGLYFAQRCIAALLARGEQLQAVKLLLRCRLVDERFRPLPGDVPAAIGAARACGNAELANALRRSGGL